MRTELSRIFKQYQILLAYQYGSSVNGNMRRDSDVDIAVMLSSKITLTKRFEIRKRLISELFKFFGREVDVVVLNDARSILFKFGVIKDGQLLYEARDGLQAEFEVRVMSEYFDFQPTLRDFTEAYVRANR